MTKDKNQKIKKEAKEALEESAETTILVGSDILTTDDLKKFLTTVRDRLSDGSGAPVYALGAMSHVLTLNNIYQIMNEENREISRDIWLRLKQSGLHVKSPPMLFEGKAVDGVANT